MVYKSTPDDILTFLLFLLLHLAVSSCLFLFFQHGLSLGRNIIPFFLLNKRGQVRRKLDPWEVILDREELAVIHTVEHPLGLNVIPFGNQNLLQLTRWYRIPLHFTQQSLGRKTFFRISKDFRRLWAKLASMIITTFNNCWLVPCPTPIHIFWQVMFSVSCKL